MDTSKVLFAFFTGAVIGAFAGVLLAPDKGSKLRRKIADSASGLLDVVLEEAEEIIEEAEQIAYDKRASV